MNRISHPQAVMNKFSIPDSGEKLLIHELISKKAEETPCKVAARSVNDEIVYSALLVRANQLARYLRDNGLTAENLVVIYLNRSIDMVIGVLGVLIAGGAFVPIDPSYPRERVRSILDDSNPKFVITQSDLLDSLPKQSTGVICVDYEKPRISCLSGDNLDTITSPDKLAYIIYTSGSTGKPKGVMIPHDSLRNFVRISQSALDVSPEDVYLQSASIAYAVSIRQLMVPLACGGSMVIATEEQARDPFLLFEEIKRCHVTLMDVVPSFWRTVINRLQDLPLAVMGDLLNNDLRRIVSVGETLQFDIPRDWAVMLGHQARLVNIFGQSETTGIVAAYPIPLHLHGQASGLVPIGRNIEETKLYILDENLKPVGAGKMGELYISNPCLARGYLNQPELTAEKFIINPFHDGYNKRLYRTGDLVRLLEDGNIEFLGRADSQVKIRGQRLELGEVESVLRGFSGVRDCVVLAVGEQPDERYLTAYIVPVDQPMELGKVRKYLRENLPDYMIPSTFIFLDKLPLSPNGKVDRRALSTIGKPEESVSVSGSDFPRDKIEEKLIAIWHDLLPQRPLGINDDFFDLGGHSLLAVRLFARIEHEVGVRLPITTLFSATTISQMAILLQKHDDVIREPVVVPINIGANKPIFFGVHGHEGGILFWRDVVRCLPVDQPFYAIQAQGVEGKSPALTRIEDMASLYVREIQKVQPHGPYYLGGFSMGGEIAFEMCQQLVRQGEGIGLLLFLDTKNPKRLVRLSSITLDESVSTAATQLANRDRGNGFPRKIQWHARRLSILSPSGKVGYFWLLLKTRFARVVLFRLAALFHARGLRLPDAFLLSYMRTTHSKALREYIPVRYPGKVTLFRSSETEKENPDDTPWSWKVLAGGGLEVYRFKATHNIVDQKYAKEVAQKLNECLVKARGF